MDPTDYVLGRFAKADEVELDACLERASEAARLAVELGAAKAMNQVNRRARAAGGELRATPDAPAWGRRRPNNSSRRANRRYEPEGSDMAETKKIVREYETIYLIKAETPDDQVDEIKERLRGIVSREGGKVIRFTNQGKRKTAFPVAKNSKALYMHCLYVGRPGLVQEFERNLKMIDVVTKFQSVPPRRRGRLRRPPDRAGREDPAGGGRDQAARGAGRVHARRGALRGRAGGRDGVSHGAT